MARRNDRTREEFVEWLCMTERTRRAWNLPTTEREFADLKGVSARQLRRWKSSDEFQRLWRQREHEIAQQAGAYVPKEDVGEVRPHYDPRADARRRPPGPPEDIDQQVQRESIERGYDPQRAEYESIKQAVAEKAREGDPQAVDKWMKYWGGPLAEEERAEREAQFAELSDDELADRVLELIGREKLSEWCQQAVAADG